MHGEATITSIGGSSPGALRLQRRCQSLDQKAVISRHGKVSDMNTTTGLEHLLKHLTAAVEQFISCSACRMNSTSTARASFGFG